MPPLESCATGEARRSAHAGPVVSATMPYGTRRREIVTFSTASWLNERASEIRPRREARRMATVPAGTTWGRRSTSPTSSSRDGSVAGSSEASPHNGCRAAALVSWGDPGAPGEIAAPRRPIDQSAHARILELTRQALIKRSLRPPLPALPIEPQPDDAGGNGGPGSGRRYLFVPRLRVTPLLDASWFLVPPPHRRQRLFPRPDLVQRGALVQPPVLHHVMDLLGVVDVLERIRIEDDQVGELT